MRVACFVSVRHIQYDKPADFDELLLLVIFKEDAIKEEEARRLYRSGVNAIKERFGELETN